MDAVGYGFHRKLASLTKEGVARWRTPQGLWAIARRAGWGTSMPERRWGALRQARRSLGMPPGPRTSPIQRATLPAPAWPAYEGFPGFAQRHISRWLTPRHRPGSTVETKSLFDPLGNTRMR